MESIFITGTDTGIGKTVVTGLMARYFKELGLKVVTQKWIQTGAEGFPLDISEHLSFLNRKEEEIKPIIDIVAPYVFDFPASPHLAAKLEDKEIDMEKIVDAYARLKEIFDVVLVEGVGGALVPYNEEAYVIDIAAKLGLGVVIVSQNKLGTINHTLLTVEALRKRGIDVLGIIMNELQIKENEVIAEDNIKIIEKMGNVPVLGCLPFENDKNKLYKAFKLVGENIL